MEQGNAKYRTPADLPSAKLLNGSFWTAFFHNLVFYPRHLQFSTTYYDLTVYNNVSQLFPPYYPLRRKLH